MEKQLLSTDPEVLQLQQTQAAACEGIGSFDSLTLLQHPDLAERKLDFIVLPNMAKLREDPLVDERLRNSRQLAEEKHNVDPYFTEPESQQETLREIYANEQRRRRDFPDDAGAYPSELLVTCMDFRLWEGGALAKQLRRHRPGSENYLIASSAGGAADTKLLERLLTHMREGHIPFHLCTFTLVLHTNCAGCAQLWDRVYDTEEELRQLHLAGERAERLIRAHDPHVSVRQLIAVMDTERPRLSHLLAPHLL